MRVRRDYRRRRCIEAGLRRTGSATPGLDAPLELAQAHGSHGVIAGLLQNQMGPFARRQDVLVQIDQIDGPPERAAGLRRFVRARGRRTDGSRTKGSERPSRGAEGSARHTTARCRPRAHRRKWKSRRSRTRTSAAAGRATSARLQHVQSFDDQDVRLTHDLQLARHDVVRQVRVDRGAHFGQARFHIGHEPDDVGARRSFPESPSDRSIRARPARAAASRNPSVVTRSTFGCVRPA